MLRSERPASPAPAPRPPVVELRGLSKSFGGTLAVDQVSLALERGQILALLGENGAGKSTLIKLLAGIYQPESGSISLDGRLIDHSRDQHRLAFIHQDHGLIESMTVAENIALVSGYQRRLGLINWRATQQAAVRAVERVDLRVDLAENVSELSRTERSLVAIARALVMQVDVLVLDEPTASLPAADVDLLFDALRRLRDSGVGMIYVTHRIDEVFRIADRVAVMRDGRLVALRDVGQTSVDELVTAIVGRPPSDASVRAPRPAATPILKLSGARLGHLRPVSFSVMAGELVGLAGLRGAGHELVGRALGGITPFLAGEVSIHGRRAQLASPRDAIREGIAFITSNREEESIASILSVRENLFLNPSTRGRRPFSFQLHRFERRQALDLLKRFCVQPRDPERAIATLSGGNQQKCVLARGFSGPGSVFVLEEPTQGVDVGARAEIYGLMHEALASGCCILILSSDFEEVAHLCHRVLVFSRGRIVGELSRDEISLARLIELASAQLESDTDKRIPPPHQVEVHQ
jgi:ribose transport system ATP-binding protein